MEKMVLAAFPFLLWVCQGREEGIFLLASSDSTCHAAVDFLSVLLLNSFQKTASPFYPDGNIILSYGEDIKTLASTC